MEFFFVKAQFANQSAGDENVLGVLHGLLDKLGDAISTGDLNNVKDTLQADLVKLMGLIDKIPNEKSKEIFSKVIEDTRALIQKLSSGEANLDDVRAFAQNARDKMKERLAAKIQEVTSR